MSTAHVIGAGLSGLATAWRLTEAGTRVEVFESAPGPGGLIGTTTTPWGRAEHAANAFVWTDHVAHWFRRLGMTPVFSLDSSRRRFIYRDGTPRRWPLTPIETLGAASRVALAVATRRSGARGDETVEQWGRRVVGRAGTKHLLAPALQGIYAAPLDRLAARAVFGHRKQRNARMAAPAGGMGEFTSRLHALLQQRGVRFHFGRPVSTLDAGAPTWICTSAPACARLLAPHAPEAAALIARVDLAALSTVTTFFPPHQDDLRGFGILFPRGTDIRALGVLFNTDIFPGRGPYRSETWIYGGPSALPPEAELPRLVSADRECLTHRSDEPLGMHSAYWPAAFPVYDHAIVDLDTIHTQLPPWLHVAGNYLGKRGVSDLI